MRFGTVILSLLPSVGLETAVAASLPGRVSLLVASELAPSGVEAVDLRYWRVNQHEESVRLKMPPSARAGTYLVEVPAGHLNPRWNFMYFTEVFDSKENGTIDPDLNKKSPFVRVQLQREGGEGRISQATNQGEQ